MKKTALAIIIIAFSVVYAGSLFAQQSEVVYVDGWVDIKDRSGDIFELFIGDRVSAGETVITGDDGVAELEPQRGSRIIIQPGTIFKVQERDSRSGRQTVLSTTVGQVVFKFNKMTQEPLITTPGAVAGVRGTEFTVYAGADGSSLITVESGAVEVSGQGESVYLEPDEGVEVKAGQAPGVKFEVKEGKIDFASWNSAKIDAMMADPGEALITISAQLEEITADLEYWAGRHAENSKRLKELREIQKDLFDSDRAGEARALNADAIKPLEYETSRMVLNYRYYALSALSLRQHILTGFYVRMKTEFITDRQNPVYTGFLNNYGKLLERFENRVAPYLVETDY
jgi:hypothetical protein